MNAPKKHSLFFDLAGAAAAVFCFGAAALNRDTTVKVFLIFSGVVWVAVTFRYFLSRTSRTTENT